MTITEKLERAVRWSMAHRGDADARAYGEDGEPCCIVCGGHIVRTHGGGLPKTCANCRAVYRAGWELSRRRIDGAELAEAIQRAANRFEGGGAPCVATRRGKPKKKATPYFVRRARIEAAGNGRVTTWRGQPCMGGGCAAPAEPIRTAWDAAPVPCVPAKGYGKLRRKAKSKAKAKKEAAE